MSFLQEACVPGGGGAPITHLLNFQLTGFQFKLNLLKPNIQGLEDD